MNTAYKTSLFFKALLIGFGFFVGSLNPLYANPTGGTIVSGSATIGSVGNTTTINQSSDKAIINWNSFNIASGETTRFNQPSASSIALNRVTGNDPSSIFGTLSANGKIMLINPNGILFGKGSNVDVAGLIATTANIKDSDFLNGKHSFVQDTSKTAGIVNEGMIKVADTGLAALVAPSVKNHGIIQANLGKVVLASGKAFTVVDTYGDNLIQFATDSELTNANVSNSGTILANGGKVLMTAKAAAGVVDNVISMDGVIEANSVVQRNGEIILSGGNHGIVKVAGTIRAKGQTAGLKGGKIKVTGEKVGLFAGTDINASGEAGGGEVLIGGDYQGKNTAVQNANATYVDESATVKANALTRGDGGKVIVWADGFTNFNGNIEVKGGILGGNGGFVETSGKEDLVSRGFVDASAPLGKTGDWLLDPQFIVIQNSGSSNYNPGNNNLFSNNSSNSVTIKAVGNNGISRSTANVILQANNDVTFNDAVNFENSGISLTVQAGRSIFINNNITTNNGAVTMTANDTTNNGVVNAFRTAGTAAITMGNGTTINTGNANIVLTINNGSGLSNNTSGDITLSNLTTTGNVAVTNNGPTNGSGVVRASSTQLITANTATVDVNGAGGNGEIGTAANPIRMTVNNIEARGQDVGIYLAPTAGITIGGASSALNGITTTGGGNLGITAGGAITQSEALTIAGTTTLAATNANTDIALSTQANSLVGTVSIGGTASNIRDFKIRNTANSSLPTISGLTNLSDLTLNYSAPTSVSLPALNNFANLRNVVLSFASAPVTLAAITASGELTLSAKSIANQTGAVSANNLTINTSDGINLTNNNNTTNSFSFNNSSSGNVSFKNNKSTGLTVNGSNMTASGAISITENSGDLTVASLGIISIGGSVSLATYKTGGNGLLTVTGNVRSSGDNVTYTADNMSLVGTTNGGIGTVRLERAYGDKSIDIGNSDSNINLGLTNTELNTITANNLIIGSATQTQVINLNTSINLSNITNNLTLQTSSGDINVNVPQTPDSGLRLVVQTNSGKFNIGGSLGSQANKITSLTINGGTTRFLGGNVYASGNSTTFNSPVILVSDAVITDAGDVTFNNSVNSDATPKSLTINSAGNTFFNNHVGNTSALASLTTNTTGFTQLNGNVTTVGAQTYNNNVDIGTASGTKTITLTTTGTNSPVEFNGTIDSTIGGTNSLTVSTTGGTIFNANLGDNNPLENLVLNGTATDIINTDSIVTNGTQTYNNPLEIAYGGYTTLSANTGLILNDPLTWTGNNSVELNVGNGPITINAPISGSNGSLRIFGDVYLNNPITTGNQGSVNVKNFYLGGGGWYQIGTLPAFNVSHDFRINDNFPYQNDHVEFIRATGGDGTAANPWQIVDVYGLQGIGSSVDSITENFVINNNIDASTAATWNSGQGFKPIGSINYSFSGSLNGQNYSITNLFINLNQDVVGLFGRVTGSVSNLSVAGNVTGKTSVGLLAGRLSDATINNIKTSGTITGQGNLGGIAGDVTYGTISNVHNSATVTGTGGSIGVGGIVGAGNASISNASNSGVITANGASQYAGGIVGFNAGGGSLTSVYNTGDVTSNNGGAGGIIGYALASVDQAFNSGKVTAKNNAGGIAGEIYSSSFAITNSYNLAPIFGNVAGGIAGTSSTLVDKTFNMAIVTGATKGALVGNNTGTLSNSFWDVASTELTNEVGSGSGTLTNLTGGCFGGICSGGYSANMSAQATFNNGTSNWNFGSMFWSNENGQII